MAPLHQKIGDGGKIRFSGRIHTKTGRVISAESGENKPGGAKTR